MSTIQSLKSHYLSYIHALNSRQHLSPGLSAYVHPNLTYNSNPTTISDYQNIIQDAVTAIPDLYYDVDTNVLIASVDDGLKNSDAESEFKSTTTVNLGDEDDGGSSVDNTRSEELTGYIAARIKFDCTPAKEIFGCQPRDDGRKVVFYENVFYRFEGGKIREVWSVIEKDEFKKQMLAD